MQNLQNLEMKMLRFKFQMIELLIPTIYLKAVRLYVRVFRERISNRF